MFVTYPSPNSLALHSSPHPAVSQQESASDKAQHAAAQESKLKLTDLLEEVRKREHEGLVDNPESSASERARGLYLRGRLLEAVGCGGGEANKNATQILKKSNEAQTQSAEDMLKKAAKLDPSLDGAWVTLAQLLWKKGDLEGAQNCYAAVLRKKDILSNKVVHKKTLCQMSMLCRSLAKSFAKPGTEQQKKFVAESVMYAKAAVKLDLTDGYSWYQVGTAYMSAFFAQGATDKSKLLQALKAYDCAEKGGPLGDMNSGDLNGDKPKTNTPSSNCGISDHPDLHFNRAVVSRYVEHYSDALNGFKRAQELDPDLPTQSEVDAVLSALGKLDDGCRGIGQAFKPKKLTGIKLALKEECEGGDGVAYEKSTYTCTALDDLKEGLNATCALRVRVVLDATAGASNGDNTDERASTGALNLHYVVVDKRGNLAAVSVYGLEDGAVRLSSTVTLLNPDVRNVDVMWEGRHFSFKLIRVDLPMQILVGGKMPVGRIARPRLATALT